MGARGQGTWDGHWEVCALQAACVGRPTEGSRDPAEPGGLGVSMPPNLLQPRNPQAEPPRPEAPPFSPGPADHYLKLEGPNNAPKETLSSWCVFYLIFQRTHSFIIQNRESKLRRNGFLSIRLSIALSNCL